MAVAPGTPIIISMALSSPFVLPVLNNAPLENSPPKFLHFNSAPSPATSRFYENETRHYHRSFSRASSSSASQKWRARVSFFPAFLKKGKDAEALKDELLEAIAPLDRGADATPEDQQRVDQIARKLEAVNPTKGPLKSKLLDGKWELIYTTSRSILQTQGEALCTEETPKQAFFISSAVHVPGCQDLLPKNGYYFMRPKILRSRTNFQAINADTLRAQNMESWPFFNQVTADLTPLNARKVAVKFDTFKIAGFIPVKAPERARGELEITYLDEELRISRGDKGNLFILKMVDPSYRVPV